MICPAALLGVPTQVIAIDGIRGVNLVDFPPNAPNQVWRIDFMSDTLVDGRRFRLINVTDNFKRESLAIEIDRSLSSLRIIECLIRLLNKEVSQQIFVLIIVKNLSPYTAGVVRKAADYFAIHPK